MKQADRFKYSQFASRVDVDAFEEAIGYNVISQKDDEDLGYCLDPWGLHKNGDTTGKFAINRTKRKYNCWVCGGGSLLSLAMAINDMDVQEAEEWLYQFTKVEEQSDDDFMSEIDTLLAVEEKSKPVTPYFNPRVLERWCENLAEINKWLVERGISDDVAYTHHLGFDPESTRLGKRRPDGSRSNEHYTGPAIIFPHFWNDRLVGWQQRWLEDDRPNWIPKYTNTSDFPKNETIYNYERVYLSPDPIIVCESVPTVLMLASRGLPAVATFGGSVTPEQMRLLRKCQQGVVLSPDNDSSGRKWLSLTQKEIELGKTDRVVLAEYLARYISVRVIDFVGDYDSGDDIGDYESDPRDLYERAAFFMSANA